MTRARMPRPHEVAAAQQDPRLLRAFRERRRDAAWRSRGVCRSVDPETFFPAPSEPADAALALCRTCGVQGACLAWALEVGDCHGVWGATTPRERRAMLVAWRAERHGVPEVVATAPLTGFPPERFAALYPEPRRRTPLIDDRRKGLERTGLVDRTGIVDRADLAERVELVDRVAS